MKNNAEQLRAANIPADESRRARDERTGKPRIVDPNAPVGSITRDTVVDAQNPALMAEGQKTLLPLDQIDSSELTQANLDESFEELKKLFVKIDTLSKKPNLPEAWEKQLDKLTDSYQKKAQSTILAINKHLSFPNLKAELQAPLKKLLLKISQENYWDERKLAGESESTFKTKLEVVRNRIKATLREQDFLACADEIAALMKTQAEMSEAPWLEISELITNMQNEAKTAINQLKFNAEKYMNLFPSYALFLDRMLDGISKGELGKDELARIQSKTELKNPTDPNEPDIKYSGDPTAAERQKTLDNLKSMLAAAANQPAEQISLENIKKMYLALHAIYQIKTLNGLKLDDQAFADLKDQFLAVAKKALYKKQRDVYIEIETNLYGRSNGFDYQWLKLVASKPANQKKKAPAGGKKKKNLFKRIFFKD